MPLLGLLLMALPAQAPGLDPDLARAAEALAPKLVECRRDLHMHPELSNREERTARVVAERLRALGLEVRTGVARHGVVGLLRGGRPGPVVAWRADMDALPIQERNEVPYASRTPGVMHACGHDVHTAVALGLAELLAGRRERLRGSVKFIFQPAEEGAPDGEKGGASLMVEEGALENPRPKAIFGLHTNPSLEVGRIGYMSGPALASSDHFYITVRGKGAHGAKPHEGIDAVTVAAECVGALQSIRSRRLDPLEPMVLTVGKIEGGQRFNVLAEEVRMEGTLRTLSPEVRASTKALMAEVLRGVTGAHGATFEVRYGESNPPTINPTSLVEASLPALRGAVGADRVQVLRPLMPAEDFSYYQEVVPGFYFFLGVANAAKGIDSGWHTATFDVDEGALVVGVRAGAAVLLGSLEGP